MSKVLTEVIDRFEKLTEPNKRLVEFAVMCGAKADDAIDQLTNFTGVAGPVVTIPVVYLDQESPALENISELSDWVDTYVCRVSINGCAVLCDRNAEYFYEKGDTVKVSLGFALKLPLHAEADVRVRSSTYSRTGFILTNGAGVIDEGYCGDEDEWKAEFYATRGGKIQKYQRLTQFRINAKQPSAVFEKVESLGNKSRGGYGSTGI